MSNQEKGLLYEKYVKDFIIRTQCKNAYLWNECPETILIDNKLIHSHNTLRLLRKDAKEGHVHSHKDIGIDIIQIENDKCSMVQCKNGYHNGLCVDDIAGIMMRSAFIRNLNTFIYYTDCLSRNILYTSGISPYVSHIDCSNNSNIDELVKVSNDSKIYFVKLPYENTNIDIDIVPEIEAYSYQIEAVNTFKEYYETRNRGILSLPCGCGKTFTSYLISKNYKQVIILSPLREFASQNLNKFIEYGYDKKNTRLVDSDGDRDINSIKKFIQSNNRFVISCTYDSMDLISECLELFNDALFIIDEFHNLSKANISSEDNNIYKLLISKYRILYMSATPRIYDIEYDDETVDMDEEDDDEEVDEEVDEDDTDEDDETVETIDTEYLFGDVVYQMTFTDAIANKYITDYKIWLPSIHENNEELDKELSIYEIYNEIKNRCKFLYSCIANNGSRKSIVYCRDTEDMKAMMECMKTLNEFYIMDIEMNSISCEDNEKKRKRVLKSFSNGDDKIQLLFNIRILNECIDIPACDSVYISYPPKNKITTIQRISRATRIDRDNPYKVANVYIWCEEYDDMLETLSSIKEYDIMFKDKVKIGTVDFYNNKDEKELEIIEKDKILLSNCIIGVKEFKMISWEEKLAMVEEYIREYGRLPTSHNTDKYISSLASWVSTQRQNYKKNKGIMKTEHIRIIWQEFIDRNAILFRTKEQKWRDTLQVIEVYITQNMSLPSQANKDKYIHKLASFISTNNMNYNNERYIMKNEFIKKEWGLFKKNHYLLFMNGEEYWKYNLEKVEEYIQINNKRPSSSDTNCEIKKLSSWVQCQQQNYKNKVQIMEREDIRQLWSLFTNKYPLLFGTIEYKWEETLKDAEYFVIKNKKLPPYDTTALGRWIRRQQKIYINNENIMLNQDIKTQWEKFIETNALYFKTNEEKWKDNLKILEDYIQQNNKLPSSENKIKEIKSLGKWTQEQKLNYKGRDNRHGLININEEIKVLWEQIIEKYSYLFKTNEEFWKDNLELADKYIIEHQKTPSLSDKNIEIKKLAKWLYHQNENYKNNTEIIQKEELKLLWEQFINKHTFKMFMTNEKYWYMRLNKLKDYIKVHNKLPTHNDDNLTNNWFCCQKRNYKLEKEIMKDHKIRKEWEIFINEYIKGL